MANSNIILQSKPNLQVILTYFPTAAIIVSFPFCLGAAIMGNKVGIFTAIFAGIGLLSFGAVIARMFIELIEREFTTCTLTETHVIRTSGILGQRKTSMPLDRSRADIRIPLLGRFFKYGHLIIQSAGMRPMVFRYLNNPEEWQEEIHKRYRLRTTTLIEKE